MIGMIIATGGHKFDPESIIYPPAKDIFHKYPPTSICYQPPNNRFQVHFRPPNYQTLIQLETEE